MLREQTESKEFTGQAPTVSSFGEHLLCLHILYLDIHTASGFLTLNAFVRCFQVDFSLKKSPKKWCLHEAMGE
jgi:hypothetical protein